MEAHHAETHAAAAQQGIKEAANWITVVVQHGHDTAWGHFLHRWESVIFSWTAGLLLILIAFFGTRKINERPGKMQNFLEMAVEGLEGFVVEVIGARGRKYVPFIGTLFLYILFQNFMGLVPGMKASTSNLNTTVALAIVVFIYVQFTGLKENGLWGYLHHLMGSPNDLVGWMMVPLNLPLHILGEFIKPVSLSLRLFGNILGEDALIAAFITLGIAATAFIHSPVGIPFQFPFMLLSVITGTIQALVFSLLTTIYILLMLPHEHHNHEHGHEH